MYTQSFEETGRDMAASEPVETSPQTSTWRHLPPQANGTEAPPAYAESLQSVLEDSERHLDALWNMLNSQMNRLSSDYAPTTEAQATRVPSLLEQTNHSDSTELPVFEDSYPSAQTLMDSVAAEETPVSQIEAAEPISATMPFDFMPSPIPSLALPEENESEEVVAQETETQAEASPSISEMDAAIEIPVPAPDVVETIEASETVKSDFVAEERESEPIPMPMAYRNSTEQPVSAPEASWLTVEPEPSEMSPLMQASLPVLGEVASNDQIAAHEETPPVKETSVVVAEAQETPRTPSGMLPPVRIDSSFRDNWMVVTAREAGGVTVLPTVKMLMQSQPNQSLQMRSTAMGEMPLNETPLVLIESREEAGSEPTAMRVEIAYSADAPDVVFEVSSQVEDEVQISMADSGSDLCASWEVSKQKGNYARAKATISRKSGDPEVMVAIERFRDPSDASVWCSLLSFSIVSP